jgi:hypothetical protein
MLLYIDIFWRSLGDSNPCFRRERAILSPKGARTLSPSAKAKTFGLIIQTIARTPIFSAAANDGVLGVCIAASRVLGASSLERRWSAQRGTETLSKINSVLMILFDYRRCSMK